MELDKQYSAQVPGQGRDAIRVVLADRESMWARALTRLIDDEPDMTCTLHVTVASLFDEVAWSTIDVLLLDPFAFGPDALEFLERVVQAAGRTRVIVLTKQIAEQFERAALDMGVVQCLSKSCTADDLVAAARAAWRHDEPHRLCSRSRHVQQARTESSPSELTTREREVLSRMAQGDGNAQIARHLGLGKGTVANHVATVLNKLEVDNRTQAAIYALRSGLVWNVDWLSAGQA